MSKSPGRAGFDRLFRGSSLVAVAALLAGVYAVSNGSKHQSSAHGIRGGLGASVAILSDASDPKSLINEGQRSNPASFTADELKELQRRFGVHGPQPRLAQLFTRGVDQLTPLRNHAVGQLADLQPYVLQQSRRTGLNPMLLAAVLFDEIQHAKPGEDLPLAAHSGLFSTHGPAQLGLGEMVKQGLLSPQATADEIQGARDKLLDPEFSVRLLAGEMERLLKDLNLASHLTHAVSTNPRNAKVVATLAYLHNGKLDYPDRILRYMQDPELHGLVFGQRRQALSPLI